MLKTTRKFTALLLSLIMILSLAVTAFGNETVTESKATEAQVESAAEEPAEAPAEEAVPDEAEAENEPELVNEDPAPAKEADEEPAEGEEPAEEADDDSTEAAAENDEEDSEEDTTVAETVTETETETETVVDSVEEPTAEPAPVEEGSSETETESVSETTAEAETETTAEPTTETPTTVEPTTEAPTTAEPTTEAPTTEAPTEEPETEPVVENAITVQPQDQSVCAYDTANFSVETTGEVSSYRWEYSTNGKKWYSVGYYSGRNANYSFIALKSDNNCQFRVKVTFADKMTVTSDPAKLKIVPSSITENPQDLTVAPGEKASFTVGLNGTASSVQWQVSENGKRWTNLSRYYYGNTTTLSFIAEAEDDGLLVRAVVSARDGKKLTSEAAKLTVAEKIAYPEQDFNADVEGAAVKVEAPEGAFPAGTKMVVSEVSEEEILAVAPEAAEGGLIKAVDISFNLNGEEKEPNSAVKVHLSVEGIESLEDIVVRHISDAGEVTDVTLDPESTVDVLVFSADSFSKFTVSGYGNVTVHHGYMDGNRFTEFADDTSLNSVYPKNGLNVNNYSNQESGSRYAYLIYDFPDYTYDATYYVSNSNGATNPRNNIRIAPILLNYNTVWCYTTNYTGTSADYDSAYYAANNSHIYVIYKKIETTDGASGSGSSGDGQGQNKFRPDVGKNVTDQKSDGTYDITLGFVGDKQPPSYAKAQVIVVFDRSNSMEQAVSGTDSTQRLTAAKNAVKAMAQRLLGLKDASGNPLVEMGLVSFGTDAQIESFGTDASGNDIHFTSNYSTGYSSDRFEAKVNSFTTNNLMGGTNWEKALNLANSMAPSDSKTYIVFISDGNPTFRSSRGNYSDLELYNEHYIDPPGYNNTRDFRLRYNRQGIFGMGADDDTYGTITVARNLNAAKEVAKSIVTVNKKGLFTVGLSSDGSDNLEEMAAYAGGSYKDGSNSDTFAASMEEIAGKIADEVGLTDVTITDGVTDMSHISTESLVGTAGNFVYHKSYPLTQGTNGYTYTIGENSYSITQAQVDAGSDGTHRIFSRVTSSGATVYYVEYPWEVPEGAEASVNANNAVVWDTAAANDELEHGVYYSVTFTVWPKQEAYDLIADLDNGIVKVTDADLEAGTKAQLRVLVNGTTYEYDTVSGTWTNGLTDAQLQALIDANDASFSMKTNTGLSASYKYGGVEDTATYTNYTNGNMTLDDTSINIKKTWNNYVDAREATGVTLTITRNGERYMDFAMGDPVETSTSGGKQWVQKPQDNLYISLGVLSVSGDTITVRETGYDYTVLEPEDFSYRWDLTADIYHPMVINGVATVLIEVQDTTGLPETVTSLAENKTVTADGKTYYKFNNSLYVAKSGDNLLEATNDRRSNLYINKVVAGLNAPEDDLFPFKITLTNPNDPRPGVEGYSETYHTFWFYVSTAQNSTAAMVIDGVVVSNNVHAEKDQLRTDNTHITEIATHEADDEHPYPYITYKYDGVDNLKKAVDLEVHTGTETVNGETCEYTYYAYYTGYYWFDNGATATISIKAGWYINFHNMGRDSAYTIVEPTADMPDGYTFDKAETAATNTQNETVTPGTVTGYTVTGTIDKPNSDYNATYTNQFEGFYYVYHSSNNKINRFPMAVDGEKVTSFNIYDMTADGTLYGGYYTDYAGKSAGYDSTTLTYENNEATDGEDAKAYTCQYIKESGKAAWKSSDYYTVNGTAAVPESGKTYFLKEVPTQYLMPYTYYTYYKADNKIAGMWAISGLDDLNYKAEGTGFKITDVYTGATSVVSALNIRAQNSTTTVKLTAAKCFTKIGMLDGYLSYVNINNRVGTKFTVAQQWRTPDGIDVYGVQFRTVDCTGGKCYKGAIEATDAPYTPQP